MLLALGATAVVIVALLLDLAWPKAEEWLERRRAKPGFP